MAKITKQQIENINNKCKNGWRLDLQYFLYHNEKTLIKHIKIDEEHYLEFKLHFNYKNQVALHISKYYHKEGDTFASSSGLGKSKILNELPVTRKNIALLIEYTIEFDDSKLLEINSQTDVIKSPIFVASEVF